MPFLAVEGVSKRFDDVTAVDRVSFAVDPGEVVGFLGPNGAGKSTTMRLITQYYEPDTGDIRLDGVPLVEAGRAAKRRIGYLPENNPLYGDMLVSEYLGFIADLRELRGDARSQALDEAVTGTGLETVYYRPIGELSKGFRQRVGLAQAILHRPDLLDAFVRLLAPPEQKLTREARQGREVFERTGCARCHVPALRTGDSPVPALRHREVAAYTDLLLHDMGPELADICLGLATPSEFRTEPLMGVRLRSKFLHDGRATTLEQAIDLHAGEGAAARDRFRGLAAGERAALIAFLKTL